MAARLLRCLTAALALAALWSWAAAVVPPGLGPSAAAMAPPGVTTTTAPPPAAELPVFQLPYAPGSAFRVSQGNGGSYTHQARGPSEFAWDFLMGEGTMVTAARAGRVVAVEDGLRGGGVSDAYRGLANYVLIAHADGLYSAYVHLATAGALVSPGEWVSAGEGIALSGNTGYSSGPHLHFQVQGAELPRVGQSLPAAFAGAGVPGLWALPVSQNRYVPAAGAPLAEPRPDARLALLTHQLLPVSVAWAVPSGPSAAPVRLVTLDAAGRVRVVAEGTASSALAGVATTPDEGWLAVWAEYRDGDTWRVCADTDGRPVASVRDVSAATVFLAEPGLTARRLVPAAPATAASAAPGPAGGLSTGAAPGPAGGPATAAAAGPAGGVVSEADPAGGPSVAGAADPEVGSRLLVTPGEAVEAAFRVENAGGAAVHLLDVAVELVGPDGLVSPAAHGGDVYLRPGESAPWSGTFTLDSPGTYTLRPRATDAAGRPVSLAPRRVGDPSALRVVVAAPGDDGDPADGDPGDLPDAPIAFADLPPDHPAAAAVQALAARGVVAGFVEPGGRRVFRPDDPVARAQFAKMLVLAVGLPVVEGGPPLFTDVEVSGPDGNYPDDYIAAAVTAGLLRGVTTEPPRFQPYAPVTRRQIATVLERAGLRVPAPTGDQWSAASRGEVAVALAPLLVP